MIRLHNVSARYGDGPTILKNISIHIGPGSFYFLTGPSGAGKSTLLRLITMLLAPSSGELRIFGQDATRTTSARRGSLRRRIGFVFQDFLMLDYLTVFENVALPLHILGKQLVDYRDDVSDLLNWVGLNDKHKAFPQTLSGGERQRVAIARSVIGKPELLVADEPTGSVDPSMARRLLRLFIELNRLGTTILIATHDQSLIRQTKAPILELAGGSLVVKEWAPPTVAKQASTPSEVNVVSPVAKSEAAERTEGTGFAAAVTGPIVATKESAVVPSPKADVASRKDGAPAPPANTASVQPNEKSSSERTQADPKTEA
jgi:cell division transport system ATP-binding protein